MATLTLASTPTNTGLSLAFACSAAPGGDTLRLISSAKVDMSSPVVEVSDLGINTSGNQAITIAAWTPRYYQIQAWNGASADASSAVTFGMSYHGAASQIAGLETAQFVWETWTTGAGGTLSQIGNPQFISTGGSVTNAFADIVASFGAGYPILPYATFYSSYRWDPACLGQFTDLASSNGTSGTPSVQSASHSFVAGDVNKTLQTTFGTHWNLGHYTITSTSGGAAVLNAACGTQDSLLGGGWFTNGAFPAYNWYNSGSLSLSDFNDAPESDPNSTAFRTAVLNGFAGSAKPAGGLADASFANGIMIDNACWNNTSTALSYDTSGHSHYVTPSATLNNGVMAICLGIDSAAQTKLANPNAVVLVNCGGYYPRFLGSVFATYFGTGARNLPFDGYGWEGYLFSASASSGGAHQPQTWAAVYANSLLAEADNFNFWGKWLAWAYPFTRDENYLAYCTAKLCNLAYNANVGSSGARGHWGYWPEITNLRLGAPIVPDNGTTGPGADGIISGCYYREYRNGTVWVNPTGSPVVVTLPSEQQIRRLDVYNNATLTPDHTTYTLPANSGRVFINSGSNMAINNATPFPVYGQAYRMPVVVRDTSGNLITGWTGVSALAYPDNGVGVAVTAVESPANSGVGYVDIPAPQMQCSMLTVKVTITNTNATAFAMPVYPLSLGQFSGRWDSQSVLRWEQKLDDIYSAVGLNGASMTGAQMLFLNPDGSTHVSGSEVQNNLGATRTKCT